MIKKLFTLFLGFVFTVQAWSGNLESILGNIEGVTFSKIQTPKGFSEAYELRIKQPVDHKNPAKGYFDQKVYLAHRQFNAPTILSTEGYNIDMFYASELALLLKGNQVQVEHRYFGASIPEGIDYTYLNLEQATADLHHITGIFKKIYPGKWISSGISKGGQTTIFYRYFYPNDMDAWIPYVAPFNLSLEDKRIYTFLDTVGTEACRQNIEKVQRRILAARDTVLPFLKSFTEQYGIEFNYLTHEEAFEYAVLEYPFSFWQWGYMCSSIPDSTASLAEFFEHIFTVSDISFFSDKEMKAYASHYYQAAAEMGYYGYEIDKFKGLIKALPTDKNPLATFPPDKMEVQFSDSLIRLVYSWLAAWGNNMIYIYGASDTWSATAIPPSANTNSVWFFMPGKSHITARIKNLSKQEFETFKESLNKMTGLQVRKKNLRLILE